MNTSARRRGRFGAVLRLFLGWSVIAFLGTQSAWAQPGSEWVGQRVVTKSGAVLRVGDSVVAGENAGSKRHDGQRMDGCVFLVEYVNGPWLDRKSVV